MNRSPVEVTGLLKPANHSRIHSKLFEMLTFSLTVRLNRFGGVASEAVQEDGGYSLFNKILFFNEVLLLHFLARLSVYLLS